MRFFMMTVLTFTALLRCPQAQQPGIRALPAVLPPAQRMKQAVTPEQSVALNNFGKRVRAYVAAEQALPVSKLKPTADIALLTQRRVDLRDAVQRSRLDSKQGDLFTAEVARVFRKVLGETLAGPDGAKIKASLKHAEPGAPAQFVVNGVFPNTEGEPIQSRPPSLLANLPVLPKGLEYVIAGKTLALRDTAANLVADYLPNALP